MNIKVNSKSDEMVLRDVLDRWKGTVDAHEPQHVAAAFTSDAIFQDLHPYGVGPHGSTACSSSTSAARWTVRTPR